MHKIQFPSSFNFFFTSCQDMNFLLNQLVTLQWVFYYFTAKIMKFSIKEFFSKCDQICSFLRIWSHLLKKPLMENLIFCAAFLRIEHIKICFYFYLVFNFIILNCKQKKTDTQKSFTAWKMPVFGVVVVRIFSQLHWMRTRKTPNMDTFHAVIQYKFND